MSLKADDERMFWFLTVLHGMGGQSCNSGCDREWEHTFCDDRGRGSDTYNLAVERGYTKSSFHDIFETSTVTLTDKGRAALGVDV